ncbi:hypothetical protein COO91_01302 [Nostoc flagelliforme CCNUN1]|uniref:Uncharacterized protein n=1 Tax=Nostoc flagelliforme CCNUN1 TaxID=2038116 RepID=A0A2K8SJ06_9NOSO|nr:hypothetical protein COO91_01302 [Nostoc flagelliforme CCNUN1]
MGFKTPVIECMRLSSAIAGCGYIFDWSPLLSCGGNPFYYF